MSRFRNWVFTLNNPDGLLTPDLDWVVDDPVHFLAYQLEVGDSGTEHFQGYLELSRPCTMAVVAALPGLYGAHFEV